MGCKRVTSVSFLIDSVSFLSKNLQQNNVNTSLLCNYCRWGKEKLMCAPCSGLRGPGRTWKRGIKDVLLREPANPLLQGHFNTARKPKNKTNTTTERTRPWERFIDFYFEIGLKNKDSQKYVSLSSPSMSLPGLRAGLTFCVGFFLLLYSAVINAEVVTVPSNRPLDCLCFKCTVLWNIKCLIESMYKPSFGTFYR